MEFLFPSMPVSLAEKFHLSLKSPGLKKITIFIYKLRLILNFINNGNRSEWSPIILVSNYIIPKSDACKAGVQFVNHEYNYRQNWMTQSPITN